MDFWPGLFALDQNGNGSDGRDGRDGLLFSIVFLYFPIAFKHFLLVSMIFVYFPDNVQLLSIIFLLI